MVANKHLGRAIVYGHISGTSDTRYASLDTQVEAGRVRAIELGYTVEDDDIFRDRFTGVDSVNDRPNLSEIKRRIATRNYSAFICYRTDRLARTPEDLVTINAEFKNNGAS